SVSIHPLTALAAVWNALPFGDVTPWWPDTDTQILFGIRLPRVVAAAGVGAALAASGVLFQALLRNPLADPFVIGSSGGAALGAALGALLLGRHVTLLGFGIVPLLGFAGAFAAVWVVYGISRHRGRTSISSLILAGFAVGSVAGALNALVVMLSDQLRLRIAQTFAWLLGGISVNGWTPVVTVVPVVLIAVAAAMFLTWRLNALAMGERQAARVGVNVERTRLAALVLASILTALAVSLSGLVAFVGLLVPHGVRLMIGPNNRLLLPAAAIAGAAYLIVMDLLARTVLAPVELPVGIFSAIVGSPLFIVLLRRARGSYDF
ncbi:MAG: iron ABC transporter permease, partial [Actinobacteria bacterium]|nr:iron ABC transporter permease [Actinomycetota bacterium]